MRTDDAKAMDDGDSIERPRWIAPRRACGGARSRLSLRSARVPGVLLCLTLAGGCFSLDDPALQSALTGPFIVSGVMHVDDQSRACSIFEEDSGVSYILFQGLRMTNEDFDQIFQDGAQVRLEISLRPGIPTECSGGLLAQVEEVLELVPAS